MSNHSRSSHNIQMKKDFRKDIIQWDINSWSRAWMYWEKEMNWTNVRNALELGGNQGGLSLWLATKGINTICSDLKDVRVTAEPLHLKYDVAQFITYQDIDAADIPYENHFDIIVFKSIIGGIGRNDNYEIQRIVFKEIYKALKPGGKLLFAENLIGSPVHQQFRKKYIKWGNSWRYLSLHELKTFLHPFASYEIKTTGVMSTFGRNEGQRNIFSAIDKFVLNKLAPDNWKYIGYGIAKK